eukprot:CAMPEP_0118691574 /NCGR_PEP_ID=MMETSP0800-20121206/10760_1 /TAXON_ID=210618 ORGANISM="Striatella unipunctata, Strain CCMP2910" /NCGR_SAMPLE_ID=MMETSP0800 /ASSEMBLY_ACC=CAM_ASM_000638 /LENGTH=149 /DNA_ID=CAMNT_0006589377 /DNA_START=41 /DNA_END=490 /DNA_ORIENTATION=+
MTMTWVMHNTFYRPIMIGLSPLLKEFSVSHGLRRVVEIAKNNRGFCRFHHDDDGSSSSTSSSNNRSPFAGCSLLVLNMDQSNEWPWILSKVAPGGIDFQSGGPSRDELCPSISRGYKAAKKRGLTPDQIDTIVHSDPNVQAYFEAYGLI